MEIRPVFGLFILVLMTFMSNVSIFTYASGQAYVPRNRLFFFILENSESRNLDGFLLLEFLWNFYQTCKFYHHTD